MPLRISRPFFIGAGAAATWSALVPSVARGAGGEQLPITPCSIVAVPRFTPHPHVRFVGSARGWSASQMKRSVIVFYTISRDELRRDPAATPSPKATTWYVPLSESIDSYHAVPADTAAIGVQLRYDGKVVPTTPPEPGQINTYPVDVETTRTWHEPSRYKPKYPGK